MTKQNWPSILALAVLVCLFFGVLAGRMSAKTEPIVESLLPCQCVCTPTKCKKCPKLKRRKNVCDTYSDGCIAAVEREIEKQHEIHADLRSCEMGHDFEATWFKEDLKTYGKPWHRLTEKEMREHDLYQKHLHNAKKWLEAIINGREKCD